ncbi:Fur family transcriptional regulator [Hespellia stercorisuis]|uniref:Fur family transcriptional regulator, ferric uptake regulator n=1 Tax=Hespellia stercorisuis DSM 15480 TaxID=1121950 RepID=A0A1M6NKB8_9FIRM|nr:transcriptional repressor [Hespellia stercorisuis]SHJ96157.1 Fur family transcriptional regulator, ferric uptake regulator [Hespellia stercorisuis DSM 15480]
MADKRIEQIQMETKAYQNNQMTREKIIEKLRENNCRITKQRLLILDIILENQCSCCKEIYAEALKSDPNIGTATVYRMVNRLEEIGAISRKNMYKVVNPAVEGGKQVCTVVLDDETTYILSAKRWKEIVKAGLSTCGYLKKQNVVSIMMSQREA